MPILNMMKLSLATVLTLFLLTGAVYANNSSSTGLPGYYPTAFQETGILSGTSSNGGLEINGISYSISPNVLIHSLSTEHSSRFALRDAKELGFSYTVGNNNLRTITELWVLPLGTVIQE